MLPNFRMYYKTIVIKAAWFDTKNGHIDQCDRIKSLEINHCTYGQLIYNKGGKKI